jgi:hypothetical protein
MVDFIGFYFEKTITNIAENSKCNEARIIKIFNWILSKHYEARVDNKK